MKTNYPTLHIIDLDRGHKKCICVFLADCRSLQLLGWSVLQQQHWARLPHVQWGSHVCRWDNECAQHSPGKGPFCHSGKAAWPIFVEAAPERWKCLGPLPWWEFSESVRTKFIKKPKQNKKLAQMKTISSQQTEKHAYPCLHEPF